MKKHLIILIIILSLLFLFVLINLHITLKTSKTITTIIEQYDINVEPYE
jgi:hypothetical protein